MLTIYLVRHGKTEWNVATRWQGWGNGELTPEGVMGAERLAGRLQDEPIDLVYSSSSKRAWHTAEIIIGNRPIQILKDDRLREMHFGDWEGRTKADVISQYANEVKAFWETPHLYIRDQGELFQDVYARAENIWNELLEKHTSGTLLIVSHSIFLRVLLSFIKKTPLQDLFNQTPLLNTSLTKIEVKKGQPEIIFQGDVSHLPLQE
ncbi:histidine phosphatase family protein [Peribacillus sp. SCS-26]|uniref:histidine phosphatase family protein n=1 Tax=Paraperibacillus marinus TaxID=3115295 RepID=UPI00390628A6